MNIDGERGGLLFHVVTKEAGVTRGVCRCCGGRTLKSHRTGILHSDCFGCRYLKMIYGPNIRVRRVTE